MHKSVFYIVLVYIFVKCDKEYEPLTTEIEIQLEHDKSEHVPLLKYCEIGKKYAGLIYVRTYNEFQTNTSIMANAF